MEAADSYAHMVSFPDYKLWSMVWEWYARSLSGAWVNRYKTRLIGHRMGKAL